MKFLTEPGRLVLKGLMVLILDGPAVFFDRLAKKIRILRRHLTQNPGLAGYDLFVAETRLTRRRVKAMKKEIAVFKYRPRISIIMPVYNVEERWLVEAVRSVQRQIYENWELCICDDGSTAPHIKPFLDKCAAADGRIKVFYRTENGGIAKASNDALNLAGGDYVALLDHDDELSPEALFEVVRELQSQEYDLIYSDEDKLDDQGRRCDPFFKPGWSPDLLFSYNYISHLGVYRRRVVEEIGGFREGFEGSQDYDLTLRFTEQTDRIKSISKVLYHWRMIPGSAAGSIDAKPHAYVAAKRALRDAVRRRRIQAEVGDGLWTGSYRVRRHLNGAPRVSIIIPFKDQKNILENCLRSVFEKTTYPNYEIILVDNCSKSPETTAYLATLAAYPKVRMRRYDGIFNYSAINNFAVEHATGEYLILLNNDTNVITPDWIESMLEHAQRPEVGAVGAKLLYADHTLQHAGVIVGLAGLAGHAFSRQAGNAHGYRGLANVVRNYNAVTAACVMIRREVYQTVGRLDERNLAVAFNDVDFCLRLREAGYLIVYTPFACLHHHESLSRGYDSNDPRETHFMQKKYAELLKKGDPYYNPNLTLERFDFSLRLMDRTG